MHKNIIYGISIIIILVVSIYFIRKNRKENYYGNGSWKQEQDFENIVGKNLCSINPEKNEETVKCVVEYCKNNYKSPAEILPGTLNNIIKDCMKKTGCKSQPSYDSPPGGWDNEQLRILEYVLNKGNINSRLKKCVLEKAPQKYGYFQFMKKLETNDKEIQNLFRSCMK